MWLAAVSDIHAGSTVAVFPPGPVFRDDGQPVYPSRLQAQLHDWWLECWGEFDRLRNGDDWQLVLNGDLVEGHHHGSPQAMDPTPAIEFQAAHKLLRTPLALLPSGIHVIRGTEAHVGKLGGTEEALARVLAAGDDDLAPQPIVADPDNPANKTSWHRRLNIEGQLIDIRHHGRMGQRAHTREPYTKWYAQEIELEHRLDDERPPDLAIRSHNHVYADSGPPHRWKTRVVSLPAWQYPTAYIHRIAAEGLPSVGLVAFNVTQSRIDVYPILRRPKRPTVI